MSLLFFSFFFFNHIVFFALSVIVVVMSLSFLTTPFNHQSHHQSYHQSHHQSSSSIVYVPLYPSPSSAFLAIKGEPAALDLSQYETASGVTHTSFLSLGWGLISDVDIMSESMRYLGEARLYAGMYVCTNVQLYVSLCCSCVC